MFRITLITVVLLTSTYAWSTDNPISAGGSRVAVRVERVDNTNGDGMDSGALPTERLCYGGLENGKLIVTAEALRDAYTQTSASTCRIDGGSPGRRPQSATVAPGTWRAA